MVDMDKQYSEQTSAHEIEQRLRTGLEGAVEAVTGDATQNPLEVFPNPADKERRRDVEFDAELDSEQEAAFRESMASLGIGRETNRDAAEVGLSDGYVALLEGGLGHKMLAELNVVAAADVSPSVVILAGDSGRIISEKEQLLTARVLGVEVVGETEYSVAEQVLRGHSAFVPQEEVVLPYGYTIDGEVTNESNGDFRQIGLINGVPAVLMNIRREEKGDGQTGFNRIDNVEKMKIVSKLDGVDSIGFVTSSTYQPSIEVDAIRAADATGVDIRVPSYGTAELARVKGEETPQPPALNQLAGEAYKAAQQLAKLES